MANLLKRTFLGTNFAKKQLLVFAFCSFFLQFALAQQRVTGTITDQQGIPVVGASVVEQNTNNGTVSDFDGNYEITAAPDGVLVFSYLGFKTKEISVGSTSVINVVLQEDLERLGEVVVIGYGTQNREEVTTAIATVKPEDFNPGFVRDAADLIRGKVAGLSISNGSGDPSATSSISLRGISSLQGNADPLVLINGLPGNLNSVAPEDIESIDVLKDASASAIYGTRGANGVILITTKSGKGNMAPTLTYSHYTSMSSFGRTADFLDANDVRLLLAEGKTLPNFGDDLGYATDWLDEISRTAVAHNHNLNYSGGNETSTYAVNVNYIDQEGVFKKSFNEEFRISADVNHTMFNGLLKVNANIVNGIQNLGALGDGSAFNNLIYRQALIRNPTDRVRNDDDSFVQNTSILQYVNPVGMIELTDGIIKNKWMRLTGNVTLTPLEGWENNIMVATRQSTNLRGYAEKKEYLGYNGEQRNGFASRSTEQNKTDLMEITSKYSKYFDKHNFSVLGGYSYQYFVTEGFWANNQDFPTDAFTYNNLGAGQGIDNGLGGMSSSKSDNTLIGFFGRFTYGFDGRFNLLASFRREGSSKFGENNKWGNFPAISAGWTLSNESFLENVDFVNNLKLRVGYGETGVLPNDSYRSLTLLQYSGTFYNNGDWVQGLDANYNPNPDLQWEVSKEVNLGLDFAFANNRISGSVDLYRKKTEGMLWDFGVPEPPNLASTTLANVGEMENKGFEVLLNVAPIQTGDFSWDTNITVSHNKNELLSLSNDLYEIDGNFIPGFTLSEPVSQVTHRNEVGQPIGNFWGLKSVGIDDDGLWVIELPDGSQVPWSTELDTDDNKQILGNGFPSYIAGITNTFRYKNFDLSFLLRGAFDFQIINAQRVFYENPNVTYNVLDSAYDPIYGKDVALATPQTFVSYYVEDGDYVKLDNVTLGYNFNVDKLKFLQSLRVYATGNNLAIFTNYSGIDPEIIRTTELVNGASGALTQGTDSRDKYPTVRTFTLGLNVNF
ncbi:MULTISPECIES: SusC/RagA family TonB-linked outer membrane protein [Flavobacteriaceae]|uniref:SusC/RagA family TonB-linked outer membrane protein n=1 Tax=Flavobacteriaceae TaxID=49546 RepID=UPI001FEA3C5A|nr:MULTISPECIES: SusC/RagA family TonB-linked outer membrane protein [Allomuricauda]MDC6365866.1 SusC/RagA family TonB-linked outer membrane protein [Muricauda sp. AC10]